MLIMNYKACHRNLVAFKTALAPVSRNYSITGNV